MDCKWLLTSIWRGTWKLTVALQGFACLSVCDWCFRQTTIVLLDLWNEELEISKGSIKSIIPPCRVLFRGNGRGKGKHWGYKMPMLVFKWLSKTCIHRHRKGRVAACNNVHKMGGFAFLGRGEAIFSSAVRALVQNCLKFKNVPMRKGHRGSSPRHQHPPTPLP